MIAWFVKNPVAANLLMIGIAVAGWLTLRSGAIPLEVFPEFPPNEISITVLYRGANPEEIEETVIIRIEEAVSDVKGIKEIVSTASENRASIQIETSPDYDIREVLDDIKSRVDAISNFPEGSERPQVRLSEAYRAVISVVAYGDLSERAMRKLGDTLRDEITMLPGVTRAELQGARPYEIGIEISESVLECYQLSFDRIANLIRRQSLDAGAGSLKTASGQISLRTKNRAYDGEALRRLVIVSRPDGTRLTLGDIATIRDGFEEEPLLTRFNGHRSVMIAVSREEKQNAIEIADTIKKFVKEKKAELPPGIKLDFWNDMSEVVKGRIDVLLKSAVQSAVLVFLVLALFLRMDLAFWTVVGIPLSFLGTMAVMPLLGVTLNIVSLFAFIMVLGIVVDDAIVVVENFHVHRQAGKSRSAAAIDGTNEVSVPVVFGVLTTMLAFVPMYLGQVERLRWQEQIATIVIVTLGFSLMESKLILPAHLAHKVTGPDRFLRRYFRFPYVPLRWLFSRLFGAVQGVFQSGLSFFIDRIYRPFLAFCLRFRYAAVAAFGACAVIAWGAFESGRILFVPFAPIQSEKVSCRISMQEGTPVERTEQVALLVERRAEEMRAKYVDKEGRPLIEHILTSVGAQGLGSSRQRDASGVSNEAEVTFNVLPPENRSIVVDNFELTADWRKRIGTVIGAKEIIFRAEIMRGSDPIDIQLEGSDFTALSKMAEKVRGKLANYPQLFDINSSLDEGRSEIRLGVNATGRQLGLTTQELATQARQAFFGEEVQRIIRGRDELRVMLRYPKKDRETLDTLSKMKIRAANGDVIPLLSVAEVRRGTGFPRIQRIDRARTVNIRADADKKSADIEGIRGELSPWLDKLVAQTPGVRWHFSGEAEEQREGMDSVESGMLFVLLGLYVLIAVPLRSYFQPLSILSAIPFGVIGAVLGHILHGIPLSMMSLFGLLALAGVAVNDGIVLVDYINRRVGEGAKPAEVIEEAGPARFRPVLLTSLTTVAGLMPLISLKSVHAQVLIPMAVSLVYGIIFTTLVTLVLLPVLNRIGEDFASLRKTEVSDEVD